jgi:threonine synthase
VTVEPAAAKEFGISTSLREPMPPAYVSSSTGEHFQVGRPLWRAPDGAHLNLTPGPGLTPGQINAAERSLWRYAAAIRVAGERISLGEGWTPLLRRDWNGAPVQMKLDYMAPTGSFKDRGMSVMLTYLRNAGLEAILEDSSGNAGASMAAYAAAGGMRCRILAPAAAPKGKIAQIAAMGADVLLVEGSRQDVAEAALREAETCFYASHNWQPFFLEGTKTLAFELWEQLGFEAPDAVVVPLGYGSNVLGLRLGFEELVQSGAIARCPRIYGAQAANCAAFGAAWQSGVDHWVPIEPKPTVADGIASVRPVRMREVLCALRDSGGAVVVVSEGEIAQALSDLVGRGLYVEPTSATAAAALGRVQVDGRVGNGESVVLVLTGSGLKAPELISEILHLA